MEEKKEPSAAPERATALFHQGLSCAQAVASACAHAHGLDEATARKVSCAFGAGMAGSGAMCGAVTGAMMVIGLGHGRVVPDDHAARDRTYALTRRLWEEFRARHGSVVCKELLGHDLSTPEGSRAAQAAGLFQSLCPKLVEDAVRIVEELG